jgi:hypothetical protein
MIYTENSSSLSSRSYLCFVIFFFNHHSLFNIGFFIHHFTPWRDWTFVEISKRKSQRRAQQGQSRNIPINPGIPTASPFWKGGLRGIFLIQPGYFENLLCYSEKTSRPFPIATIVVPRYHLPNDKLTANSQKKKRERHFFVAIE